MFIKITYIFALRGKQVRIGPMKKMETWVQEDCVGVGTA